jgi:hypothetical protein
MDPKLPSAMKTKIHTLDFIWGYTQQVKFIISWNTQQDDIHHQLIISALTTKGQLKQLQSGFSVCFLECEVNNLQMAQPIWVSCCSYSAAAQLEFSCLFENIMVSLFRELFSERLLIGSPAKLPNSRTSQYSSTVIQTVTQSMQLSR